MYIEQFLLEHSTIYDILSRCPINVNDWSKAQKSTLKRKNFRKINKKIKLRKLYTYSSQLTINEEIGCDLILSIKESICCHQMCGCDKISPHAVNRKISFGEWPIVIEQSSHSNNAICKSKKKNFLEQINRKRTDKCSVRNKIAKVKETDAEQIRPRHTASAFNQCRKRLHTKKNWSN